MSKKKVLIPKFIAMTRSFPGTWVKRATIEEAIKILREEDGETVKKYGIAVYSVHPRTLVNGMGGFRHPTDHRPKLLAEYPK